MVEKRSLQVYPNYTLGLVPMIWDYDRNENETQRFTNYYYDHFPGWPLDWILIVLYCPSIKWGELKFKLKGYSSGGSLIA